MKQFELKKHSLPTPAQGFARLVGNSKDNQIVEIPLDMIDEIDNQPHKIHEEQIEKIAESISHVGQIDPVIVVENPENKERYLLLSGRHRVRACELLKKSTVKAVIITETDPDKQRFILISSNNDRNADYLPSELAYAYLEQKQLLERFGSKQVTAKIAEDNSTNRKSVHKYIQLTKLTKPLLYKVDKGELTVGAGYELSYLDTKAQESVNVYLINHPHTHISKETARLIRENPKEIHEIVSAQYHNDQASSTDIKTESEQPQKAQRLRQADISIDIFNEDEKAAIAHCIYNWINKDIHKLIIQSFASTDDVVAFLHTLCLSYSGWSSSVTFLSFNEECISVDFYKNKCTVTFNKKKYSFSLKEIDTILRQYIKTQITTDRIIEILKAEL